MIKKTIAIAALALIATSGLASARTIQSPRNNQTVRSETVAASSFYNALNQYGAAQNQVFNHPGDNDMDRYHTNKL